MLVSTVINNNPILSKGFEANKYLHIDKLEPSPGISEVKISKIDPLINNKCPNYTNYMDDEKNKICAIRGKITNFSKLQKYLKKIETENSREESNLNLNLLKVWKKFLY